MPVCEWAFNASRATTRHGSCNANDINDSGTSVGECEGRPFIYKDGVMRRLTASGWNVSSAILIAQPGWCCQAQKFGYRFL